MPRGDNNRRLTDADRVEVVRRYTTRLQDGTWEGSNTIAVDFGVHQNTIIYTLRRAGVAIRDAKEAHAYGKRCGPIKHTEQLEEPPLCACGCGQATGWDRSKYRWKKYVRGHYRQNSSYKDETWLREQYITLNRSVPEMAAECEVNVTTVIRYMERFGIKRRDMSTSKVGRFNGSRNPAWKGGVAKWKYAPEWKRIAHHIRKRDSYTCRLCNQSQPPRSKTLHVHHIDGDKTNNDPSNLMTVCAKCHPQGKRKEHYNKAKDPHYRTKWLFTRKGEVLGLDADAYMTAPEARARLGVRAEVIPDLIKKGVIVGKKIGHFWYVERASLEIFAPKYIRGKHHRGY